MCKQTNGGGEREKQKLTPRMTEQSHKKRSVVIYEIINLRCGLRRPEQKRFAEAWRSQSPEESSSVWAL